MADQSTRRSRAAADAPAEESKHERRSHRASARDRLAAGEHSALGERLIAGVPARIMRPRLVYLVCLAAILGFGLLMVYSASAVEALSEYGSSTYLFERQGIFILIGIAFAFFISRFSLDLMRSQLIWYVWAATLVLLAAVLIFGRNVGGATRWINLPLMGQFQPSEFAKAVVIVTAAKVLHEHYEEQVTDTNTMLIRLAVCVAAPLLLIVAEPDLGSCIIIVAAVLLMCFFAGFSYRLIIGVVVAAICLIVLLTVTSSYRMERVAALLNPWSDPYGSGYQATLAIMAFASGGLFGRGIGNSTMKYNYLPEAHNDYILAIIGEEVGFVGTVLFIAVFALFLYEGYKIASQSPTVQGRLIAYGCTSLIMIQFLINMLGILGVIPMTGKPLPFISYGGSSMIATLALAGLVMRVSMESNQETVYDARRAGFRVVNQGVGTVPEDAIEGSTAGVARPRSARRHTGFSVVDGTGVIGPDEGGRAASRRSRSGSHPRARQAVDRSGSYKRVNLGTDPADRLRSRGVQRRYDDGGYTDSPRGGGSSTGRGVYDR